MSKEQLGVENNFTEGAVFYTKADKQYHIYKLLAIDKTMDCYHVLSYKPLSALPSTNEINNLEIFIYHIPVARTGFKDAKLLSNNKIVAADLIGYHEYLRQTQEPDYYIPLALEYFNAGLRETDEKLHYEAIESYSKAIDLIPKFYEAIDNRAFCKMDLGLWVDAIKDFQESLVVNPQSILAEFSIGECYLKMKNLPKAKEQFEKALSMDPTDPISRKYLEKVNDMLDAV